MGASCRCRSDLGGAWWSNTNWTLPPVVVGEVEYGRHSDRIDAASGEDLGLVPRMRQAATILCFSRLYLCRAELCWLVGFRGYASGDYSIVVVTEVGIVGSYTN